MQRTYTPPVALPCHLVWGGTGELRVTDKLAEQTPSGLWPWVASVLGLSLNIVEGLE